MLRSRQARPPAPLASDRHCRGSPPWLQSVRQEQRTDVAIKMAAGMADVEDHTALGRGEGAEVREVGVPAELCRKSGRGRADEVVRHDDRGAAAERVTREIELLRARVATQRAMDAPEQNGSSTTRRRRP